MMAANDSLKTPMRRGGTFALQMAARERRRLTERARLITFSCRHKRFGQLPRISVNTVSGGLVDRHGRAR
jgi:hypothetical protein